MLFANRMVKSMRIMLITFASLMSDHGGAEKVYAEMANNFLKKGHIVCALYFDSIYGG